MQFSIFAAALTLGSALAVPFHGTPAANNGTYNGSAPALPAPAVPGSGTPCILETVSLVASLKLEVRAELVVVKTLANGPVDAIESKILSITSKVEECKSKIETLLASVNPEELPAEDRESILCLVSDLQEIVFEVQGCIVSLVGVLSAKILAILLPKLSALKDCLGLLVAPVLKIAFAVCALVQSDVTGVIGKILFAASDVQNCLAKFLSPVSALIGQILV